MTDEYDPLTADLIERLFAASRKAASDEQDLLVEAADALEANGLDIAALRGQAREWLAANAPGGWIDALRDDAERYRELRRGQKWSVINGIGDVLRGDDLDSAIDAAKGTT